MLRRGPARRIGVSLLLLALGLVQGPARAEDATAEPAFDRAAIEFFEKEVRPLLAQRCQGCHGPEKQKSDLRLDSRAAALAGGLTGPAVVPGKPEESLLVEAIGYGDLYQMPPKSKLPDQEIATLTKWVRMGAPWPDHGGPRTAGTAASGGFDLKARASHWSFQPLQGPEPPAVHDTSWPRTPIDRFLLAKLEAEGLTPAPDADRRTLIRRLTFDLTGLPPTPVEIDAFLNDTSPEAYERLVERLLASPRYGERWARHWLDLVRYAETAGHEFDYDTPDAWRYRDYVIRAFNADLPYDRFVVEHIAGDLLEAPRRHPTEGFNESILGTGFYFLGEGTHSPVDVREDEVLRIDNQIDVLSKTFLGLTVACARCHDHKFDAISTADYYALSGYLQSSRHQHAFIDPPDRIGAKVAELRSLKGSLTPHLTEIAPDTAERVTAYLLKARESEPMPGRDHTVLGRVTAALSAKTSGTWTDRRRQVIEEMRTRQDRVASSTVLFEDFDGPTFDGWFVSGDAFGDRPSRAGDWRWTSDGPEPVPPGRAHSGLVSERLQGVLRSRTFPIEHKFIHVRATGKHGRINLVIDGFEKIRAPIYGALTFGVEFESPPRWYAIDVSMWVGHKAYIEIGDGATVNYTGGTSSYFPGDGYIAVDEIRFSDDPAAPDAPDRVTLAMLDGPEAATPETMADRFGREIGALQERWRSGQFGDRPDDAALFEAFGELVQLGVITLGEPPADLANRYREIEATVPPPTLALAITDGTGEDEHVHLRGNYRTPGELAPRRFLEAIAGGDQPAPERGSGRLELARRMIDPSCPLTPRVMVNRIWQHHFGKGIVATPDDFGAMGEPPTHPELLDWLARRFVAEGWSIKRMHRLIVNSHAYRMQSTKADPEAERIDPANRWLHRANVRRLEAEAIRDAMLAVSGSLDSTQFGPSVPPHLTPFMEGRGRPGHSGPLDGDGRRSLYINVRRNFMTPMLLAFDYPPPATTMGRRNVSNVPAQALTLLNDPFVIEQARRWADRVTAVPKRSPESILDQMYLSAFGRPPTEAERDRALAFLDEQARSHGEPDDPRAWADLAHVLLNVKEFLYIP